MLALLQRVAKSQIQVNEKTIASIGKGLLVFIAIEPDDTEALIAKCVDKIISYRIFSDHQDKMNLSLKDIEGELLLVSQFTLAANTQQGLRPSFGTAAPPDFAHMMYEQLVRHAQATYNKCQSGQFAADMQVSLINDGPVTFMLTIK